MGRFIPDERDFTALPNKWQAKVRAFANRFFCNNFNTDDLILCAYDLRIVKGWFTFSEYVPDAPPTPEYWVCPPTEDRKYYDPTGY